MIRTLIKNVSKAEEIVVKQQRECHFARLGKVRVDSSNAVSTLSFPNPPRPRVEVTSESK